MATKQLIIDIPDTDNGRCPLDCPMCQNDSDEGYFCATGLSRRIDNKFDTCFGPMFVPGQGCPQYDENVKSELTTKRR